MFEYCRERTLTHETRIIKNAFRENQLRHFWGISRKLSSTLGVENCRQSSVENNKFNFKILFNFLAHFYYTICKVIKCYVGALHKQTAIH